MNNIFTVESLAKWIEDIKEAAKEDTSFSIAWFKETEDTPFSIVAGWTEGAFEDYSDIFCVSKTEPKYVMAIKIVINEGPYAYTDFDAMSIPLDKCGEIDSACIPLEWNDSPEAAAQFFLMEWERIMEEHEGEF